MKRIQLALCIGLIAQFCFGPASTAAIEQPQSDPGIERYTAITKRLMMSAIELERFSLKYRLESARQPKFRRFRYFLAQETGSAGGLAFEIVSLKQLDIGKSHPLKIDKNQLHGAFTTATTASIIAASGSAFELSSNFYRSIQLRKQGYDTESSRKFVVSHLREIDGLLTEREKIISVLPNSSGRERAIVETEILHDLRSAFAGEFTEFQSDLRGFHATQNTFYFLNASYNTIGAISAGYGYKSVTCPWVGGTTNILFLATGALAGVTPAISSTVGAVIRNHSKASLRKDFGITKKFDSGALAAHCAQLEKLTDASGDHFIASLPATQRLAIYSQSGELFRTQLANETRLSRKLSQVALQMSELGPPIGGLLLTQGILGTVAAYNYQRRPFKQLTLNYDGAVLGTVGFGMGVVGNAALLLANWSFENTLKKKNQLPRQLIFQRLNHLDDLEKTVQSI